MDSDDFQSQNKPYDGVVGAVLDDRFDILGIVSSGGAGDVLKVRHREMDKIFAAKVMRSASKPKPASLKRFKREAQILCKLQHPNIVAVHSFGMDDRFGPYLIMDLLEGVPLSTVVRTEGPMPLTRASKFFIEICEGMSSAHRLGIVHRDIKPSNVMVVGEGEKQHAVIIDFGAGKLLASEEEQKLTGTSAMLGTPMYMSPEQCMSKPVDKRSDVYAMGCLMYEVLTGKPPFNGQSAFDVMSKHLNDVPTPPSVANPSVRIPTQLDQVITMSLRKNPEDRFDTFSKIKEAIELCLQRPTYAKMFSVEPERKISAINPRQFMPIVLVACLAIVVAYFWYGQNASVKSDPNIMANEFNPASLDRQLDSLADQGRHAEAIPIANQLINYYSRTGSEGQQAKVLRKLASYYLVLNLIPQGLAVAERMEPLEKHSNDWAPLMRLTHGQLALRGGQSEKARRLLQSVLADPRGIETPDRWSAVHDLAEASMETKRFDEAEKYARQAIASSYSVDSRWLSWTRLARIQRERGNHDDAIRSSLKAETQTTKPEVMVLAEIALDYHYAGNEKKAQEYKQRAVQFLKILPNDSPAQRAYKLRILEDLKQMP